MRLWLWDYEGAVVKAREEDWFKRGVKETIHIKGKASDLNKDKGHHQLPSVYDSIISSDRSTTSGQMTQSPANSNTNISCENFVESIIDIVTINLTKTEIAYDTSGSDLNKWLGNTLLLTFITTI